MTNQQMQSTNAWKYDKGLAAFTLRSLCCERQLLIDQGVSEPVYYSPQ